MDSALIEVRNLSTSFRINGQYFAAVDDVSLDIYRGETLAIVGESGSGKSSLALSLTRLIDPAYARIEGYVGYMGSNLTDISEAELNQVRGRHIGMIFQDPLSALNPLMRVGQQVEEGLVYHTGLTKDQRRARALELLADVGLTQPRLTYTQFPYELSGGMRQRVMIAMALCCRPSLIIADEPTTALDVTIQAQILDLLRSLQANSGASVLLITHDLGVVAEMADRVAVMYAGQIVELAACADIFTKPRHPYTCSLLASNPGLDAGQDRLHVIQGIVPSLANLPRSGCRFSRRLPRSPKLAHDEVPTLSEAAPGHYVMCSCHKTFDFQMEVETHAVTGS